MNQHEVMVNQHEVMVNQHEVMVSQHEVMVNQHEVMVNQHEVMVNQHDVIVRYRTAASAVERRPAFRAFALVGLLALTACGNAHERLADSLTRAVMANDLSPVIHDLAPSVDGVVTRVRVAEWSDEMAARGAYQGVKQTHASWCSQNSLCFDANFADGSFHEVMKLKKDGKVTYLWIRPARNQSNQS